MEDFHRQFLTETVERLENLNRQLKGAEVFSDTMRRESFRALHTVKGTAQTFGFNAAGNLAHELETLLSAGENPQNLLVEGIELLQKTLTEESFQLPEKFTEKLRVIVPLTNRTADGGRDRLPEIPIEFYSQLSGLEKKIINAAVREGKNLAVLEIGFGTANFAAEMINFRQVVNASGEIVATFPSAKFGGGKIGFQFLIAGLTRAEELAETHSADVLWKSSPEKASDEIGEVLRRIVRHGEEVAAKFNKQIEITTQSRSVKLSPAGLTLVFEVLLHLVRNAVDHAFKDAGTIKIVLKNESNGVRLSVSDDGHGIDLERIKARAIEKKLISDAKNLTRTETLNLIFQPEFSTKTEISEISGRGIGLDAVKTAVEKSGGKINVFTKEGKGTTFEIFLPQL